MSTTAEPAAFSYTLPTALSALYLVVHVFARQALPVMCVLKILSITQLFLHALGHKRKGEVRVYSTLIMTGLLFSLVGDIFMELSLDFKQFFVAGLGSFLAGHIAFIFAFGSEQPVKPALALPFYVFAAAMFRFLKPYVPDALVFPVLAYTVVISTMGWRAAARLGQPETVSLPASQQTAFWGALLFIASDSMIALDKFYSPIPQCKLLVMVTYYAAQILITASVHGGLLKPNNKDV